MRRKNQDIDGESQKRLSLWRLSVAFVVLAVGGFYGAQLYEKWLVEAKAETSTAIQPAEPWFAAYIDVTSTPLYSFEQFGTSGTLDVMLSFVVSSDENACEPSWGAYTSLEQAALDLDLDRRIARLRQRGGDVAVSFGGLLHDELAVNCTDSDKLYEAYDSVISRYQVKMIDLDIEGSALADTESLDRRSEVIAKLQKTYHDSDKELAVWLTLPVTPQGLTPDGTSAVENMLRAGVDLAGINIMTMDYGESREGRSMIEASRSALIETHRQLGILYSRADISLSGKTLWQKIGVTPMIGQNDVVDEVFTLDAATSLNTFASDRGVGRISMWSANRDIPCGGNYVDTRIVSDSCSGVGDVAFSFAQALSKNFIGRLGRSTGARTTAETGDGESVVDDPENSPYQIWQETGAYLKGTKIVWHGNVYEAKWWTKNDLPDNPVLQSYETPWKLIGPVLPGEKPIEQPKLPSDYYPAWSGEAIYEAGSLVMFEGTPFRAKWWNSGESPAIAAANPDNSPWIPLSQAQIDQIIGELKSDN